MSAPTNRWKLGTFVVASVAAGLTAAVALTAGSLHLDTVTYASYFDESATGLEVGSPIRFRGVRIGSVSAIGVAPDRRHVQITYSLGVALLKRLGLADTSKGKETKISTPPDLRMQIASTGLAGTKYLELDFFDTGDAPPPVLPFPVPDNTIPTAPSTMKYLEDAVVRAVDQVPPLMLELKGVMARANVILDDVNQRGLPARAAVTLDSTNQLLATVQHKVNLLPVAELSRDATATFEGANAALAKINRVVDLLGGDGGLVASMQRSSDSLADLTTPRLGDDLNETGRDLREAAVAVRQLVEALQRDPDMLLKGKTKVRQ